ncbi:hypothetical protein [Streptomyces sp. G-G2]|uniref:hypothetical protein n=1 Tax=Streptomyces sp. G-G2 TaxID=3046201 RepID=UPI0024B93727|nr:hypothetical protein [Streptomyces sp. G-G2]MDJ0383023.1 hypothetical protein [Streptomyces sp. G-G2]
MTACAVEDPVTEPATEPAAEPVPDRAADGATGAATSPYPVDSAALTIAADGSYAARLAGVGDARYPERWTLDGPEPYAVPLPLEQPEEADSEVLPLADGRVLIHRRVAGHHGFSLLYPTGPRTGQLPLGAVECERLTLLPPAPDGRSAYALAVGDTATTVWQVAGCAFGPERVAEVPGRCSGGVWLDREGRLLALDREREGRTKAVVVDLGRGGEVSPLLQITEVSDDRLLLADPDSGLLLIRSDAPSPGEGARLGWGVLGSARPVRFPECLRTAGASAVPFAVQPGQMLMPESCAVALRIGEAGPGAAAGAAGIALWRPADRHVFRLGAPMGWLGTGLWSREGRLRLPYATPQVTCGVVSLGLPQSPPPAPPADPGPVAAAALRPVPLQQAPLR